MSLESLLQQDVTADPKEQLYAYLRSIMPAFVAPTDAAKWKREIPRLQKKARERVCLRGFPKQVVNRQPRVVWGGVLRPDASYVIRKLRYEIYPDYWIPALLYEPTKLKGKVPVVLNPNGHHRGGKATDYKQTRCANIARRGMLALNIEYIGMSELEADCQHNNIAHLDLTGMAGVGLFYLALQKGLDVLLAHRHADAKRVCVTGLSGGGWQTITISAFDPRVTVCVPVAGYTAIRAKYHCLKDYGDMEQTPTDLLTVSDYDTMTAMLAPRPALLILNENDDCCFQTARARPVIYDAVRPTYEAFGAADNFATHNNTDPGTHNYGHDNRSQFYKFLNKHFSLDTPDHDIHRGDDELYPEDQLRVGLPGNQQTMLSIALARARKLIQGHKDPKTAAEKKKLRQKLAGVIQLKSYEATAATIREEADGELLRLDMGPWALAATVEKLEPDASPIVLLSDEARSEKLWLPVADPGTRYYVDILGTGTKRNSWLELMAIQTTGQRLLGIQTGQILAAARLVSSRHGSRPVRLVGQGMNVCFAGLMAAGLEPKLFASVTDYSTLTTLRYLIEWPTRYEEAATCFCFGLLEVADVPQIRALMEGVEYRTPGRATVADWR